MKLAKLRLSQGTRAIQVLKATASDQLSISSRKCQQPLPPSSMEKKLPKLLYLVPQHPQRLYRIQQATKDDRWADTRKLSPFQWPKSWSDSSLWKFPELLLYFQRQRKQRCLTFLVELAAIWLLLRHFKPVLFFLNTALRTSTKHFHFFLACTVYRLIM